jgi:ribosomal-protein-alanine acetyltransferase
VSVVSVGALQPIPISTRLARVSDLTAIVSIEDRSFAKDRFPRRNLRRLLASRSVTAILAESGSAPAGYALILFRAGADVARLYSIAVDPTARGRGAAKALIEAGAEAARKRGATRLRLELRSSNAPAQRLYERAGFTILERKPGYYADGEDAIRMELRLDPPEREGRSARS